MNHETIMEEDRETLTHRIKELEEENRRLKSQLPAALSGVTMNLIENIINPLFVKDAQHKWIYVNKQFAQLMGKTTQELIGKTDRDFISKKESDDFWRIDNKVLETGEDHVSVDELFLSGGNKFTLLTLKRKVVSDDGVPYVLATITDFSELKRKEEELLEKNEQILKQSGEIKLLLKEIHHRVKNNLQIIISVLNLQSNLSKNKELYMGYQEVKNKIISMARIHEMLYQSQNLSEIDVKDYVRTLTADLIETYSISTPIHLKKDITASDFGINTLIPLGLILTELISNAIKHGFKNVEKAELSVSLKQLGDQYQLVVSDNGNGFDRQILDNSTLGFDLVNALVEQLNGTLNLSSKNGTEVDIIFESID